MRKMLYRTWYDMKSRCYDHENPLYYIYGGRGIKVCERWLDTSKIKTDVRHYTTQGFENFLEDMGPTWFPKASIDRIDNDGDYTPENCQWLTRSENSSKSNAERIQNGTHNWKQNGQYQSDLAKKRIADGNHIFLSREWNQEQQRKRIVSGTHNFITNPTAKGTIWVTNGSDNKRIPKDSMIPEGFRKGRAR